MVFYTLNQIINLIEQISLAHAQVNSFGFGEESSISASEQEAYPLVWLNLQPSTITDNTFSLSLSMLVCDIVKADDENERDTLSDCLSIAQDLYAELTSPNYQDYFSIQYNVGISPVREGLPDLVNGFRIDLVLDLEQIRDRCQIPFISGLPGGEPVCSPAVITLNGDSFLVVNSGATTNVTLIDENGDEVTPVSVVGSVIELPPTGGGDATVTLMGDAFLTIPAGDTENILIQDASDSNIEPSSVTGNIIKYNINIKPHFTVAPVLSASGNQNVGTVITCGNGTVLGVPTITYTYQWKRNGVNFVNVGNSYTLLVGDVGTVITCSVTATNGFGFDSELTSNSVTVVASSLDPDAEAFLNAAGITDPTIINATDDAFVALKTAGYYASGWNMTGYTPTIQCFTLYPNLGGSASTAKWNMCDPRDLNAAYRKTYFGGVTFDSYGEQSNGTNGYARTHLVMGAVTDINNLSMGFYSFTNSGTGDQWDMGVFDPSAGNSIAGIKARTSDFMFAALNQDDAPAAPATTDSTGFHAVSRINGTQEIKNIRGTNTINTRNSANEPTAEQYLMAVSLSNSPFGYSVRKYGFQFHAAGQTTTQLNTMEQIISDYMIALGRV